MTDIVKEINMSIFNTLFGGIKKMPETDNKTTGNERIQRTVHKTISPQQAKILMSEGKPFILLDVRTPEEFADGHIPNAILMPDYEISKRAAKELTDKNALILVYCHSGRRAAGAAAALAKMGYSNVNTFGGISDWPYEVVK